MSSAVSRREESRHETAVAFFASVAIHILLILGVGIFLLASTRLIKEPAPEEEEPVQLTILPPLSAPAPRPRFVDTPLQEKLERKPDKNAAFESANDSLAASEAPPTGAESAPSLEGREEPSIELQDRNFTAGKSEAPAMPSTPTEATPRDVPDQSEPTPTPRIETELAPLEAPEPPPTSKQIAKPANPQPKRPAAESAYQSETRVTRLRGNVSNRGRAAVEANATPLGKYKKALSDAIGSRWNYYVRDQMGLLNIGTVEIRFTVTPAGKVKAPRVLSNTSNESFASVSLSAIMDAKIPAIPPEVVKLLENGGLEIDYSFSILGN